MKNKGGKMGSSFQIARSEKPCECGEFNIAIRKVIRMKFIVLVVVS